MGTQSALPPSFSQFTSFSLDQIKNFVQTHGIKTVYLPLDGTRRFFLMQTPNQADRAHALSMKDPRSYFNLSIQETIRIIKLHYDMGIQNVILLLMDDSAFNRPQQYLSALIKLGIYPIKENPEFLDLFKKYDVHVTFGGFNERYVEVGYPDVLTLFQDVQKMTQKNTTRHLIFYTGTTPQQDYIRLLQKHSSQENPGTPLPSLTSMIKELYHVIIPPISYSIFYNFPRDKILPPLLWGNGVRFYMANPSLSLTRNQVLQAIYYTALSQFLIKDDYVNYAREFPSDLLNKIRDYYFSVQNELFGPSLYHEFQFYSALL